MKRKSNSNSGTVLGFKRLLVSRISYGTELLQINAKSATYISYQSLSVV